MGDEDFGLTHYGFTYERNLETDEALHQQVTFDRGGGVYSWYEALFSFGFGWGEVVKPAPDNIEVFPDEEPLEASGKTEYYAIQTQLRLGLPLIGWPDVIENGFSPFNVSAGFDFSAAFSPWHDTALRYAVGGYVANTFYFYKELGVRTDFSFPLASTDPLGWRVRAGVVFDTETEDFTPSFFSGDDMRMMVAMGFSAPPDLEDFYEDSGAAFFSPVFLRVGLDWGNLEVLYGAAAIMGRTKSESYVSSLGEDAWIAALIGPGLGAFLALMEIPSDLLPLYALAAVPLMMTLTASEFYVGAKLFSMPAVETAFGSEMSLINLSAGGTFALGGMVPGGELWCDPPEFYYDLGLYVANTAEIVKDFGFRVEYAYSFFNALEAGHRITFMLTGYLLSNDY